MEARQTVMVTTAIGIMAMNHPAVLMTTAISTQPQCVARVVGAALVVHLQAVTTAEPEAPA